MKKNHILKYTFINYNHVIINKITNKCKIIIIIEQNCDFIYKRSEESRKGWWDEECLRGDAMDVRKLGKSDN